MRKLLLIIVLLCSVSLTGCVQLANLTEEESDIIADYSADTLLKFDKNYKGSLIDPEILNQNTMDENTTDSETTDQNTTDTTGTEEVSHQNSSDSSNPVDSVNNSATNDNQSNSVINLSKELGNGKFNISYFDYAIYDSYPGENNYFSLETSSDRQLLVVKFKIKNSTEKNQNLNLIQSGFKYTLEVDSNVNYNPKLTLLVNDMQYINMDISAGDTKEAVVVFDIKRGSKMAALDLIISNKNKTSVIKMK